MGYVPGQPVLKGISLHLSPGRRIALVGLSGGGKTTLVKLISRFYDIQQGAIKIDGVDIRLYPLDVLRKNISMVLQDSILFEGTIRENIAIGHPGASIEQVVEVAKKANIHETIMNLPEGYETTVREQGKNFSGGQRQRIAIARAILRDAPILILDEPTAALDVESEAEVMRALDQLVVNRTVIVISHRLSTLGNVDEILVLKQGQIVEQGSYKQLKQQGGIFAHLLAEQNRYSAEGSGNQSILHSAFQEAPTHQKWVQPAALAAPTGVMAPPVRSSDGNQPGWQPQPQTPPAPMKEARVLIELDGKIVGDRRLDKPVLTIGRLQVSDVYVPNQRVSRLHARIRNENDAWVIEDAESLNGIVYQGTRIERLALTNGDRIYLGPKAVLHYQCRG
jgi:ABC-type multidrug transport system ATPase subunit